MYLQRIAAPSPGVIWYRVRFRKKRPTGLSRLFFVDRVTFAFSPLLTWSDRWRQECIARFRDRVATERRLQELCWRAQTVPLLRHARRGIFWAACFSAHGTDRAKNTGGGPVLSSACHAQKVALLSDNAGISCSCYVP